ncbi:hypothetical protein RMATCC62417_06665 [Rhizopus microsporus]|nr:hypothetical protein RMATCC62417_06665 [Rhizopus microsporus]
MTQSNILSPPMTPKRKVEAWFCNPVDRKDLILPDSVPDSPPSSTLSAFNLQTCELRKDGQSRDGLDAYIVQPLLRASYAIHPRQSPPLCRQKRKPKCSLPTTTQGSFTIPIAYLLKQQMPLATPYNKVVFQDQTRKRKNRNMPCTTKKKLLRLAASDISSSKSVAKSRNREPKAVYHVTSSSLTDGNVSGDLLSRACDQNLLQENDQDDMENEDVQTGAINSNKAKRDAAYFFDQVAADSDIATIFKGKEDWIPKVDALENRAGIRVAWKGSPLKIQSMPYFEKLHPGEVPIASGLRLTPEQYLRCKYALILAAHKASQNNSLFRRSEAQKACCIDVNKASVLWKVFGKLGWLGSKWPN